ncbi:hypothetical protein SAY86_012302 [Trapa natans]|uniref:Uncharacterized protein n=1 Tax=Trapa natans TaxID=22666 RepID=A0AAN7LRX6_TRANT|nr:hypothetical protein SAY86_012302 [Trapa natans]
MRNATPSDGLHQLQGQNLVRLPDFRQQFLPVLAANRCPKSETVVSKVTVSVRLDRDLVVVHRYEDSLGGFHGVSL